MQMQQPENQRNLLLAIILSVGVLLAWQTFYAGPKLKQEQERQRRIQEEQAQKTGQQPPVAGPSGQTASGQVPPGQTAAQAPGAPVAAPGGLPQIAGIDRTVAIGASRRIPVETPSLRGSINLTGGRIDDLVLTKYRQTVSPTSPNVVLFSPLNAPNPYFAEHGWVAAPGANVALPGRDTNWLAAGNPTLTPTNPVQLTWDNGAGLTFRRTISVDENYMFKITDEVENKTANEAVLYPYARIYRLGTPKIEGFFIQHEGLIGVSGDKGLQEITYSDARKEGGGKAFDEVTGGWLGFTDKYWAAALVPDQAATYRANYSSPIKEPTATSRESFQADYLLSAVKVAPGAKQSVEGRLYAGAKKVEVIEDYDERFSIRQFDLLIDWGWFYFITKPLYHLIAWLYKYLGNFGLAILVVTVIVKAAFFWFANKSYESMAKMKKLQPEMEKLRERYKDDKMRQQQELMELYRKEKINPLAGCLPVLVQIPVFFALYKVLFVSIDMRHAPFFGWIRDLSAPDPTSMFNLFGLLPYAVPEFLHIGVWPLIMGITMFLQMQLNPQQPDPVQQQVFNLMPIMFTFLLASFPAGLVIYWAWNNVLSLAQQYVIMKRQGVDVPLWQNLKRVFGNLVGLLRFKPSSKS